MPRRARFLAAPLQTRPRLLPQGPRRERPEGGRGAGAVIGEFWDPRAGDPLPPLGQVFPPSLGIPEAGDPSCFPGTLKQETPSHAQSGDTLPPRYPRDRKPPPPGLPGWKLLVQDSRSPGQQGEGVGEGQGCSSVLEAEGLLNVQSWEAQVWQRVPCRRKIPCQGYGIIPRQDIPEGAAGQAGGPLLAAAQHNSSLAFPSMGCWERSAVLDRLSWLSWPPMGWGLLGGSRQPTAPPTSGCGCPWQPHRGLPLRPAGCSRLGQYPVRALE